MEYPRIKDSNEKLKEACLAGIDRQYASDLRADALVKMEEELNIIKKQGSASAYVLVYNALTAVDAEPAEYYMRGSIGSSLVSYLLGFTDTDPISCKPRLYSIFYYGINGDKDPTIEAFVSPNLQKRLVNYFENYPEDDKVEFRRGMDGKLLGVYVGELKEENRFIEGLWNVFCFGFSTNEKFDEIGKETSQDEILNICKPGSFIEYVKCYGLRFGTGTWEDTGKNLFLEKSIPFMNLISCREDVYEYMIDHGVDERMAYDIAEYVRKGKVERKGWTEELLGAIEKAEIPDWYRESCQKIKYLFPRAHIMEWIKTFRSDMV